VESALLFDIVLIFSLSLVVLFACQRLKLPTIVGFLIAGVIVGPSSLGLIDDVHQVETLAEIGVILLLFTIGIEFSLSQLTLIKKAVLLGGSLQVGLTVAAGTVAGWLFGLPWTQAIFVGFLVSLSSTAIVIKILQEKAQIDSPQGRISLGILIFQDIIIVPMILITPLLAGTGGNPGTAVIVLLAKGAGIILFVLAASKWLVPWTLYQITRTRNHELFLLSVVVICFGVAWLTSLAGLSLALGAFLAGLIISETEYSQAALGNILPFRGVFTTFFFISIGMMLNLDFLFAQPLVIFLVTLAVMASKAVIAGGVALLLGYSGRIGILVGCALCQIGEFTFILSRQGIRHNLFSEAGNDLLLSVAIFSMAVTPLILGLAPKAADAMAKRRLPLRRHSEPAMAADAADQGASGLLMIIGFGVIGGNVARAARAVNIPYAIIETNPDTVRRKKKEGEPIYYGDATYEPVLEHAGIGRAKCVVVAINDPTATRGIIEKVHGLNPAAYLIVRTRYVQEVKELYELGADEVIPEEFETSVEIFARILAKNLVPRDEIEKLVAEIRSDGYEMFRQFSNLSPSLSDFRVNLPEVDISAIRILKNSPLTGRTIGDLAFRKRFGVSIVAIRRDSAMLANPGADADLREDDVLYLLGTTEQIAGAAGLFSGPEAEKKRVRGD